MGKKGLARETSTELVSWEHAACPLSGINSIARRGSPRVLVPEEQMLWEQPVNVAYAECTQIGKEFRA